MTFVSASASMAIEAPHGVASQTAGGPVEAPQGLGPTAGAPNESLDPQPNPAFGISFAFSDGVHRMGQTWVAV
jgi:hypothetical protein